MVESKFSIKQLQTKITESLSLRVFVIAFVLIIIPLLIHSVISYRQEYKVAIKNIYLNLALLGEMESNYTSEKIENQDSVLDAISQKFNFEKESENNFFESPVNEWLQNITDITAAKNIFYLSYQRENTLLCTASSNKSLLGQTFTEPYFLEFLKNERSYYFDLKKNLVFVAKTIYSKETPTAAGLLVISFLPSYFIEEISYVKDFPYWSDLSILSKQNQIVTSSNAALTNLVLGKDFQLISMPELPEAFLMKIGKEEHMAVLISLGKIPQTHLLFSIKNSDILSLQREHFIFRTLLLFAIILIFGGGGAVWLTLRISKPLKQLLEVMNSVAKGDIRRKYFPDHLGFEINILGTFFNGVVASMVRNQQEAEKQRLEKQIISQELKLGHAIQQEMLPIQHIEFPGLEISSGYVPAKEVSGDFFDLFPLDDNRLLMIIADTSGKGIPACFYSLNIRSILRSFALSSSSLKELMEKTNALFCKDTKDSGIFVTAWVAIYKRREKTLSYSNAGHYPALLKRDGAIHELSSDNSMAFGIDPNFKAEVKQETIENDDLLLLYTDGVLEAQNDQQELYGKKRLMQFVTNLVDESPRDTVKNLLDEINHFSRSQEQRDDITILAVRSLATE